MTQRLPPLRPPPVPFKQRAFHAVGRLRDRLLIRRFEQECRDAPAVNRAALAGILAANAHTGFGRQRGFAGLTPDTWAGAVPLHTHDDLRPWIERMAQGEDNVLCAEPVPFFARTSGSTGAGKLVPTPPAHQATYVRFYSGLIPAVAATRIPGAGDPHRGMALLSTPGEMPKTPGGASIGSASAGGLRRVKRLAPYLWTSPWPVFEIEDVPTHWHLHALFALTEPTTRFLWAVFAPHLLAWLKEVERRFPTLVREVHDGRLSDDLSLTTAQRSALQEILSPDPARARVLEAAVAPGFEGFAPRVWPWLRFAMTVITGGFAVYAPQLQRRLGEVPIYTSCYASSEAMIGLNLEPDRPERYVLTPGTAHFEFIPLAAQAEAQPATVALEDVQEGERYEVVLSNRGGLYRYRLRDVVRVEGWHHRAPVLSFQWRLGTILDLAGEKSTEDHVQAAVRAACGDALHDYTVAGDTSVEPPRYVFYLELEPGRAGDGQADHLDAALSRANGAYARMRRGTLRPAAVRLLPPGTFDALARWRLDQTTGVSIAQLKPRRLVQDAETLAWLEARVV
ncbi:MAG: GH3 auxin-responsive promoter family protein [Alphaproteobacteria bacterium]|nr:GH3 auxin-responsive promoter family protein [Alphaproteobacteria bacterium]